MPWIKDAKIVIKFLRSLTRIVYYFTSTHVSLSLHCYDFQLSGKYAAEGTNRGIN